MRERIAAPFATIRSRSVDAQPALRVSNASIATIGRPALPRALTTIVWVPATMFLTKSTRRGTNDEASWSIVPTYLPSR